MNEPRLCPWLSDSFFIAEYSSFEEYYYILVEKLLTTKNKTVGIPNGREVGMLSTGNGVGMDEGVNSSNC